MICGRVCQKNKGLNETGIFFNKKYYAAFEEQN